MDGEPKTDKSTSTQPLSSVGESACLFLCCFMSTQTTRLIRNGEPETDTSILTNTQFPNSVENQLACFNVPLRPQKPHGLLGTGSPRQTPQLSPTQLLLIRDGEVQDGHLNSDKHTAPELCGKSSALSRAFNPGQVQPARQAGLQ